MAPFTTSAPALWVEPKGDWGAGAVQLVEIPTEDETHDNIVAYWRPDRDDRQRRQPVLRLSPLLAEQRTGLSQIIAKVVATRLGRGGIPGTNPWPRDKHKFVVDFTGGPLTQMQQRLT